ncbi:MAG: tyrosine-type recombinase/integrase [Candidatus Paceibacteria bacterium]
MSLTDTQIKGMKPKSKSYKVSDGNGLFLEINPSGSKLWRFKYRYNGKQKLLAIGKYPDITLKQARDKRQQARQQLADGLDPSQAKKEVKRSQEETFGTLAQEWFEKNENKWTADHAKTIWRRLEMNVLPWIKDRPIKEITTRELLGVLRRVEHRGAVETAHRLSQIISKIFIYSVASGVADSNPAADLQLALQSVPKGQLPGITDPKRIKDLMCGIDSFEGSFIVKCALQILPLVFVRPGELRKGLWDEVDFDNALWTIPAHRMKKKREHVVPLSRQALDLLRELYPLTGGENQYIFPTVRSKSRPMSEGTLGTALKRIGFEKQEMVPHGFRTTASTRLHEMGWNTRLIELQLAHIDQNKTRSAYNKAEHLEDRRRMMQAWADYLDSLKAGAPVLPFQQNNT